MASAAELCGICHASGNREAVPEGPCGDINTWQLVRDVAAEVGAVLIMGKKLLEGEKPPLRERRIEAGAGVPLAQHETVAGGTSGASGSTFNTPP